MSFSRFNLSPSLHPVLDSLGFKTPYPIQEKVIPAVLDGRDILGIAPTGSGKTASYLLPIFTRLSKFQAERNRHIQALIVLPTRELAIQVQDVFQSFSANTPERIKSMAVYGGVSINPQMKNLIGVTVLIATPGRLLELIDSNAVHLDLCKILVLDEADKLLSQGFKDEMGRIIKLLPQKRQNLLFSATLNEDVSAITEVLLNDPLVIKTETESTEKILIDQSAYRTTEERKGPLLRYLIKSREMKQVLVFTNSAFKADTVAEKLWKNGIKAGAMHSKKSQEARRRALSDFKSGKLTVLVATDLISRGIDIEVLPFVINYELPRSPKDYIHRIGRTGRAEASGEAISLVSPDEEHHFKIIRKKMKVEVELRESVDLNLQGY